MRRLSVSEDEGGGGGEGGELGGAGGGGWGAPTLTQAHAWRVLMGGRDLVVIAPTGIRHFI
jgi:hypothetical protein